jgi:2-methylcitrate dehydratase PrpD
MVNHGVEPGDRASFLTSLPYQLALAACDAEAAFDVSRTSLSPTVAALMQRIDVRADPALLAAYPARWPARIVVTTREGTRAHTVEAVPGDPERPLAEAQLREKFSRLTAWCGEDMLFERARAVFDSAPGQLMASLDRLAERAKATAT